MSKLPATKSHRPLASLNQQAATLAADERGDLATIPTEARLQALNINGNNNYAAIAVGSVVKINSDEVITKLLDVIAQQAAKISELTDKVISQASEIVDLKLKLNGLQL